jgi:hypothetical protein
MEWCLTLNIPSGVPLGSQTVIFCDPVVTITTDVLLIFVCVPHQLNPLPVQFKSLLPGQEGCVFFSGHLNTRTCHYVLLR